MPLSALDIMGHFHCTSKSSGISRSAMLSSRVGLLPSERQMQIFPLMLVVVAVSGQDAESQNAGRCIGCLEGLLIHVRRSFWRIECFDGCQLTRAIPPTSTRPMAAELPKI